MRRLTLIAKRVAFVALVTSLILGVVPLRVPGTPIGRPQEASAAPSSNPGAITFYSNRAGNNNVYLMGTQPGSAAITVTASPYDDNRPTVSPDGKRLAFSSNRPNSTGSGNYEIWVLPWNETIKNFDESLASQLTADTGNDSKWPKWSPENNGIAFERKVGTRYDIWTLGVNGGGEKCVTCFLSSGNSMRSPDWSANGHLAFERIANNRSQIFRSNHDGTNLIQLTTNTLSSNKYDRAPAWSRDQIGDAFISFASDRSGLSLLYKIRPTGPASQTPIQLTQGPSTALQPSWSISGPRRIIYAVANSDMFMIDEFGKNPVNLSQSPGASLPGGFCCEPRPEWAQAKSRGNSPGAPVGADPVNLASGNMAYRESDLVVATSGPQLALNRTHNNTDQGTTSLGPGWRTNFDESITYTAPNASSGSLTWVRADGRSDSYQPAGTPGVYSPSDGRHDGIVRTGAPELTDTAFVATDVSNVTYRFDARGALAQVRDRLSQGYDVGRDSNLQVQDVTHTRGPRLHFDYDATGLTLTAVTSSDGRTVSYASTSGRLVSVSKPGGLTWQYGYDDEGRLFEIRDPSGRVIYEADLFAGQVAAQRDGRGNGQGISYLPAITLTDLASGSTTRIDEFGRSLTDTYDSRGFATSAINQEGATTRFGYNSAGDRTETTDAIGATWRTSFTPGGDPREITNPIGAVTRADYRPDHQPNSTTDPTGLTAEYSYDDTVATGTLTAIDPPGSADATTFVPNPDGTIALTMSGDGLLTQYGYDSQGRPITTTAPGGQETTTVYNPDGTVAGTVGPDGATTQTFYDAALRPVRVEDPLANSTYFGYDAAGNQTSLTDAKGYVTNFGYDPAYNLYETSATVDGVELRAHFGYDEANRLTETSFPEASAGVARTRYTPAGRLESTTDPDSATWSYTHTPRGEVETITSPDGAVTTLEYDAAGRLITQSNSRETPIQYSYDLAGRPLLVEGATNTHRSFGYDTSGRLFSSEDQVTIDLAGEQHAYLLTSTLSPGGRYVRRTHGRYQITGPLPTDRVGENVAETNFDYNADGTLATMRSDALLGPGEISNTYEPTTGRLAGRTLPGGSVSSTYRYDLAGRATELTNTLPGGVLAYPTRYDPAGNVTRMGDSTYSYDSLGRLKTAFDAETGATWTYSYDKNSNRTAASNDQGVTQTLNFGVADEITTTGYAYDEAGRLVTDTTTSGLKRHYIWDGYGRLKGVDLYSPQTGRSRNLRMKYDASGTLVEKDHYIDLSYLVERRFYHYDGDRLVGEEDMTGTVREYLYAGGEAPTAMRARQGDGSYQNYFFVTNTHGDVVALTDPDGTIVNRYAYGPWGEATRVSEQVHQPFRYAGYRYEDGFDLYYLRARWYDAGTGRFLSRDPRRGSPGNLRSLNRYSYGGCAPSTMVDPGGRSPRCAGGHADLPSARALNITRQLRPLADAVANAFGVPRELILNTIYHENDEDGENEKLYSAVAYTNGSRTHTVGPMNVSRNVAKRLGLADDGLLQDHINVAVGTAFLKLRMNQGAGLGDSGTYDEWLTLVYRHYVAARSDPGTDDWIWQVEDIFGVSTSGKTWASDLDPAFGSENRWRRFRDYCARLESMRGL